MGSMNLILSISLKSYEFYVELLRVRFYYHFISVMITIPPSVRNFGCPCARNNQKGHRTTTNTDAVVRRTTIKFPCPICETRLQPLIVYLVPSTDNQKLGRTTKHLFFLISNTDYTVKFLCVQIGRY